MKKDFKILSIDGGGIKGLYPAIILRNLENKYGPIYKYFDMICGTSTGGIIALALSSGVPANEIVNFYRIQGPKIFKSIPIFSVLKQLLFETKYSVKKLRKALKTVFENKIMEDALCYLCIPSVDITCQKPVVFKTPHQKKFERDGKLKMVDVALATSAAPLFFPIVSINNISDKILDGGIWQNNPALIGLIEAITYFVGTKKEFSGVDIFSIGNLQVPICGFTAMRKNASLLDWNSKIVRLPMDINSKSTDYILKIARREKAFHLSNYLRIEENQIPSDEQRLYSLDNASKRIMDLIEIRAVNKINTIINNIEVKYFFKHKVLTKMFTNIKEGKSA